MRFVTLSLLVALVTPALAEPTTKPAAATQPVSDTLAAVRKVQITGDPVKQFPDYIQHIASDVGLQVLGSADYKDGNDLLRYTADGDYITLQVTLRDTGPFGQGQQRALRPAAAEFLDGIIDRVQKEMQQDYDDRRGKQLNQREQEVERIHQQRDAAEGDLKVYRDKLRNSTGRLDITPKNLRAALSHLQDERQQLELDLRGKEARGAALAKAIAELTEQAEQKNKGDEVLVELQKVVDAREKQLELMKKNAAAGLNAPLEVQQVAAETAEARAKVAERKRDALAAAGGEALGAMNRELRMLSIDRAEQEMRFKLVSEQLAEIGNASELIDKYEQTLGAYPKLVDRDDEAQRSFREIRARLDMAVKPAIKVTYARDWTRSEMSKPASNPEDGAHPATKQ